MNPFKLGIIGEYQSGKSLLINCLLQRSIATVGVGTATTHTVINYIYCNKEHVVYKTKDGFSNSVPITELYKLDTKSEITVIDVYLSNEILRDFILIDMPGFGANDSDNTATRKMLSELDFAIVLASNNKTIGADSSTFNDLLKLRSNRIPYYLILNCINTDRWRYDDPHNINIARENLNILSFFHKSTSYPLNEDGLNIVNLLWYWYSITDNEDELINRKNNKTAFANYGIERKFKHEVGLASNFNLLLKIFDMENRAFLELKRDLKEEIQRLKEEIHDELCPIGTIQSFSFPHAPKGWLVCDGSSLLINEYNNLFQAIGTTFGGDGKKYFQIPDLRGRFIRGWENNDEIRKFGSLQEDSFQGHEHSIPSSKIQEGNHKHTLFINENESTHYFEAAKLRSPYEQLTKLYGSSSNCVEWGGSHTHTIPEHETTSVITAQNGDVRISDETRPKNIAMLFCIKY